MRISIIFLIFISVTIKGFSQTACSKYDGDYNRILSELKNRNIETDAHRLYQTELENIAKYWVAVCNCEKGAKTREEANELYLQIPASAPRAQYMYHGKMIKKKVDNFGDLIPIQKIYTPTSCIKGSATGPIDMKSSMDCTSEAANFYRTASDKQQFGKAYFRAYCECRNGTSSPDRAKFLIAEMKINHQNYHQFKAPSDPTLSKPITDFTDCKISSSGQTVDPKANVILNPQYLNLLNDLGEKSNDPDFKKMVNRMNKNHSSISKYRDFSINHGIADQNDIDFYNTTENIAQGVAAGIWVASWFKTKIEKLTPDQKNGINYIKSLSTDLRKSFDEVKSIPTFFNFNQQTIDELNKLEFNISTYQNSTLLLRSLFWEYQAQPGYLTLQELNQVKTELQSKTITELYELIENKSTLIPNYNAFPHMLNHSEDLNLSLNKILFTKVKSYNNIGDTAAANEILNTLTIDSSPNNAIRGLVQAMNANDYYTSIQFYEPLKNHFYTEGLNRLKYPELLQLNSDNKGLSSTDATLLMCAGVTAYISLGQISQAKEEIKALDFLDKQMIDWVESNKQLRPKKKPVSDEELYEHYQSSHALILATKANLENKLGHFDSALKLINSAIELDKNSGTMDNLSSPYLPLKLIIKLKILINQNEYSEAKIVERELKNVAQRTNYTSEKFRLFSIEDIRYNSAILAFKEKKYQKSLMILDILIKADNKRPKYYTLQTDIYKAMGQIENQKKSEANYNQLITQDK